jgi:hypothetical protein
MLGHETGTFPVAEWQKMISMPSHERAGTKM